MHWKWFFSKIMRISKKPLFFSKRTQGNKVWLPKRLKPNRLYPQEAVWWMAYQLLKTMSISLDARRHSYHVNWARSEHLLKYCCYQVSLAATFQLIFNTNYSPLDMGIHTWTKEWCQLELKTESNSKIVLFGELKVIAN